jgi:hypothetical protein
MTGRKRMIYWRENIKSFLPVIDRSLFSTIIREGFRTHIERLHKGNILTGSEFNARFIYYEDVDGRKVMRTHPSAKSYDTEYSSFSNVNDNLIDAFGVWVPDGAIYAALYGESPKVKNGLLDLHEENIYEIEELLSRRIEAHHRDADQLLKKMHGEARYTDASNPEELHAYIHEAIDKTIREDIEDTFCEDRWFGLLDYKSTLFLESIGCMVEIYEVDALADTCFREWTEPHKEHVEMFLRGLWDMGVKEMFEKKYNM